MIADYTRCMRVFNFQTRILDAGYVDARQFVGCASHLQYQGSAIKYQGEFVSLLPAGESLNSYCINQLRNVL
jgi:hypothetical protein